MGRMLAVASGKGGVGKSTVAVQLASALARAGRQVLLVDGDIGMRCLDLMLGLTDSLAFDLSDILLGRYTAQEVILKSSAFGVSLLPAPLNSLPELSGFKPLLTELTDAYDFVILDLPAGPLNTAELLPRFCEGLVVSNPGSIPLRDAAKTVQAFQSFGVAQVRLVLNRVTRAELKKSQLGNLDDVIDYCKAQLIALIPESRALYQSTLLGRPLAKNCSAAQAFNRFAARLTGHDIPVTRKVLHTLPGVKKICK